MENRISQKIRCLSYLIDQDLRKNDLSLSGSQCFVLSIIYNHDGKVNQNELEKILKIRRSTVTSLISNLERDEYILRTSNINDKRQKMIILTDKGYEKIIEINKNIEKTELKIKNGLTEEEAEQFLNLISKLINNMKEKNA